MSSHHPVQFDHQDIADVLVRYATGIDTRDWPLFRTCFTEDCDVDYGDIGAWRSVDEIEAFMVEAHAGMGHTMHRITNVAPTIDGDFAACRAYVDALLMNFDGAGGINAHGFYDDDLVRTPDGWRIAKRRFTTVRIGAVDNLA